MIETGPEASPLSDIDTSRVDLATYLAQYARNDLALASAYGLVHDKTAAEDLAQDAVVRLINANERSPTYRSPGAWTLSWRAAIRSQWKDDLRHEAVMEDKGHERGGDAVIDAIREREQTTRAPTTVLSTDPLLIAERSELIDTFSHAAALLEPRLRAVVLLTMWKFEGTEIAEMFAVNRRTVARWREDAYDELRKLLAEFWAVWSTDVQ